jgi:hypothetical protein
MERPKKRRGLAEFWLTPTQKKLTFTSQTVLLRPLRRLGRNPFAFRMLGEWSML